MSNICYNHLSYIFINCDNAHLPDEYAEKAFKHAQEHATKAKADDAMAKGKQGGKK